MRKTVLLMGLLAMMLSATAQNVSVKTQGESPVLGLKKTVMGYTHLYGMDDKSLFVRYATGKPMKVDKVCLGRFNKLMDMEAMCEFDNDKATPMVVFVNDNDVAMILHRHSKDQLMVTSQHFAKQSLEPMGEPVLLRSIDLDNKHLAQMDASNSENQQYAATLCLEQLPDSAVKADVVLYDSHLEEQWHMESNFIGNDNASWNLMTGQLTGAYSDFFVSNNGEVLITSTVTNSDNSTVISLIQMNGKEQNHYTVRTYALGIRSAKVLKCEGDLVYITGNQEKVYARNVYQHSKYTTGLYMLVYNMKTKKTQSVKFYPLNEDDCRVLRNQSGKASMALEAYNTSFTGAACDEEGFTMTFVSKGIVVMRANKQGEIEWVRRMRNDNDATWDQSNMIQVFTHSYGDKVLVAVNRDNGNVDRDTTKVAEVFKPGKSDAVLTCYLIDRLGNVSETNAALPPKSGMLGRPVEVSKDKYVFVGASNKSGYWGEF